MLTISLFSLNFSCIVGDPAWQEVAKRYQEIIDRENKLLRSFPVYLDGQMSPLFTHASQAVTAPSTSMIDDANNKGQHPENVRRKKAPIRKSTAKQTCVSSDITDGNRLDNGVTENKEDKSLPKIVEVYSLNSSKIQGRQVESRKRKNAQCLSSFDHKETFGDATLDGISHTLPSRKKPCLKPDCVIDLTGDENDEESTTCSSDDKAVSGGKETINTLVNNQRESELSRKGTNEIEIKLDSAKGNRSKRKGGLVRKTNGKRNHIVLPQQRSIRTNPAASACGKGSTTTNNNDHDDEQTKNSTTTLNNNKDIHEKVMNYPNADHDTSGDNQGHSTNINEHMTITRKTLDGEKQKSDCDNYNSSLEMSYRKNKIMNLKTKLAKQEEELARLRKYKGCKSVTENCEQATLDKVNAENLKQKENSNTRTDAQISKINPETVDLEDICQHVIKSFDIFNARNIKKVAIGKRGFNDEQVCISDTSVTRQSNVSGSSYNVVNKQDEFLFHVGLRRNLSSHKEV